MNTEHQQATAETVEQQPRVFIVAESRKARLDELFAKLAKTASKLGVPAPSYTVQAVRDVEAKRADGKPYDPPAFFKVLDVVVHGAAPVLAGGWQFAATIDYTTAGEPLLRVNPDAGLPAVPARFRAPANVCEHCHTTRNRAECYVVYSAERNEWRQVGSSCLADFLGGMSPTQAAALAGYVASFEALEGDEWGEGGGGRSELYLDRDTVVALTASMTRRYGYWSKSRAEAAYRASTADLVRRVFYPYSDKDREEAATELAEITEADRTLARAAIDWARAIPVEDPNEFRNNLRVLATDGSVAFRNVGMLAAVVPAFNRETADRLEREARPVSEFYSTPGTRTEADVEVVRVIAYASQWDEDACIVKLLLNGRDEATWFTSAARFEQPVGAKFRAKFTVKAHEIYKERKQTVVTRLAIQEAK